MPTGKLDMVPDTGKKGTALRLLQPNKETTTANVSLSGLPVSLVIWLLPATQSFPAPLLLAPTDDLV